MLEVEVKFPTHDLTRLAERLKKLGAQPRPVVNEVDHYFNAPDRDFKQTDEAFRLRRIGSKNRLTYKGPKRDAQTKTRTEIEVPLANGEGAASDFRAILVKLGYRAAAIVNKTRQTFHLEKEGFSLEICLDDVDQVGTFVELEIVTAEDRLEEARRVVMALATELGLGTTSERRSYLQLLLEKQTGKFS